MEMYLGTDVAIIPFYVADHTAENAQSSREFGGPNTGTDARRLPKAAGLLDADAPERHALGQARNGKAAAEFDRDLVLSISSPRRSF